MVAQSDRTVTFRLRVEADPSAPAALRAFGESITSEGKRAVNDFAAVASRQIEELQRRIQSMARGPRAATPQPQSQPQRAPASGTPPAGSVLPMGRMVSRPVSPQSQSERPQSPQPRLAASPQSYSHDQPPANREEAILQQRQQREEAQEQYRRGPAVAPVTPIVRLPPASPWPTYRAELIREPAQRPETTPTPPAVLQWPAQRPEATHIPTTVQRISSPLFNQPAPAQPGDLPEGKRVHRALPFREVENLSIVREAQKQRTEQDNLRSRGGRGPEASPIGGTPAQPPAAGKPSQQERDLAKQNARDAADAEKVRREALGQTGRAYEDHIRKLERIRELEAKGKVSPGTAAMARREEIDRFTAPARRDAERQSVRDEAARQREEQQRIRGAKQAEDKRKQDEARAQREQNKRTIDILRQQDKEEGERQKAIERDGKARERAVRDNESARKKMVESNLRVGESFKTGMEGAMGLARGFAYLGITGEDSTEKILKGLMRVEGAIALVKGSITIISSVAKTWMAVRDATAAATAAAKAHAAMQALAGAAGVAGAKGAAVGVAGGSASGVAGGAVGGVAGGAAASGGLASAGIAAAPWVAAAAGTLAAGWSGYETVRDIRKYGFGGGATPGGFNDFVSRHEASGLSRVMGWTRPGSFGRATLDNLPGGKTVGTAIDWARSSFPEFGRLYESDQATARAEKRAEEQAKSRPFRQNAAEQRRIHAEAQLDRDRLRQDQQQRDTEEQFRRRGFRADQPLQYGQFRGEQFAARYAREEQERRIEEMNARRPNAPELAGRFAEERRAAVEELRRRSGAEASASHMATYSETQMRLAGQQAAEAERKARKETSRLRGEAEQARKAYLEKSGSGGFASGAEQGRLYDAMASTRKQAEEASLRETAASQARLQLERDISGQKIAAAQQSVEIGRREIESRTQAIENYRRQLTAGAESFGSLNRGDMSQAVNAMQAAREGRRLSDQQLGLLDRVQTEDAQRAASEQRQRRAFEHFGGGDEGRRRYEEVFGRTERQGIERNERAVQRLQVDVQQQELQVNIDRTRDSSLVQTLSRTIYDSVRQHNEELVREVGREVDRKLAAAMHDVKQETKTNSWIGQSN